MLVKIEARILIFPGTDVHFPSTSVPPDTFLGSGAMQQLLQHSHYFHAGFVLTTTNFVLNSVCSKANNITHKALYKCPVYSTSTDGVLEECPQP